MRRAAIPLIGFFFLAILLLFLTVLLLPASYPHILQYVRAEMELAHYRILFAIKISLIIIGMIAVVRWILRSKAGRELFFGSVVIVLFLMIVFTAYHRTEKRLERSGMAPGVLFTGYDCSDTLVVSQCVTSDEDGVNRFGKPMPWLITRQLNAQGFISPFNYDRHSIDSLRKAGKPIIALIGDSFLEGVSENMHVDSVFIEMIRRRHPEWALVPFGVGGTGPADYMRCARKYLPDIQPDILIVVFYAGNDIMKYDIPATPGIPNFWQTNCGWLESTVQLEFTGGEYVLLDTPEKAYAYYRARFTLFGKDDWRSKYFRQSRVLTSLYCNIYKEPKTFPVARDSSVTYSYLMRIYNLSERLGCAFAIAVVPDLQHLENFKNPHGYEWIFKDLFSRVYFPKGITRADYIINNEQFNDSGNREYSYFLDSLINIELGKRKFMPPLPAGNPM